MTAKRKKTTTTATVRQKKKTRKKQLVQSWEISRMILGVIFFILALCVLFRRSYRDAVIMRWISVIFPGLIGYGYNGFLVIIFLRASIILCADMLIYGHSRRPALKPLAATLCVPIVWGAMVHLQSNVLLRSDGGGGILLQLWRTGQAIQSGGALGGLLAEIGGYLLPKPVALILLFILLCWLFLLSMRQSPSSLLDALESFKRYERKLSVERKRAREREREIVTPKGRGRKKAQTEPDEPFWTSFTAASNTNHENNKNQDHDGDMDYDGDFYSLNYNGDNNKNNKKARGGIRKFFAAFVRGTDRVKKSQKARKNQKNQKSGSAIGDFFTGFISRAADSPVWNRIARLTGLQSNTRKKSNANNKKNIKLNAARRKTVALPPESESQDLDLYQDISQEDNLDNLDNLNADAAELNPGSRSGRKGGKRKTDSNPASDADSDPDLNNLNGNAKNINDAPPVSLAKNTGKNNNQATKPVKNAAKNQTRNAAKKEVDEALNQELSKNIAGKVGVYRKPNIDKLLEKSPNEKKGESKENLNATSRALVDTLRSYGVRAKAHGAPVSGPSVTRYDFELAKGTKLSKVTGLADDIALVHGWERVRIVPIPNPTQGSIIGIETPNREPVPVLLLDVLKSQEFKDNPSATAFALGKNINGKSIVGNVEQLPHVLVAGTTGSGKSVCMNCLIISMLCKSGPENVRFIMIDPKMVELAPYNGIPHLLIPVVTDPKKAAGALQWAVGEMLRRYKIFSENGVKKLEEYNQRVNAQNLNQNQNYNQNRNQAQNQNKQAETMPAVVVVIDELADLMIAAAKEVEESIMRIAQMGRAAGIHLVIATQRPSADVITGLMKANIPSRIAFAVSSGMESRIILDTTGAEKLVGRGDMLYAPLGGGRIRVQGCYVSPHEIENIIQDVKARNGGENYDASVSANIEAVTTPVKFAEPETRPEDQIDELLPAAVEIILETEQASVSMLQRRLKLGYSRAARLIDQMEARDYIGPFEGSKPRKILITPERWEEERAELKTGK